MMVWMRIVHEGPQGRSDASDRKQAPLCIFGNCFVIYVNIVMVRKAGHVRRPLKSI